MTQTEVAESNATVWNKESKSGEPAPRVSAASRFTIADRIVISREDARLEKYHRYAELLETGDESAVEEVQRLADELRIDTAQLLADMKTIQWARELESLLVKAKADQVPHVAAEARKALEAHKAETDRIAKERAAETMRLDDAEMNALNALRRADGNQRTLKEMIRQNPALLHGAASRNVQFE